MLLEIAGYRFQALLQNPQKSKLPLQFREEIAGKVHSFHRQLPGYKATVLVSLKGLAKSSGVGDIFVKNESTRFDLKAFKVLGSSYAAARLICRKLNMALAETDYAYLVSNDARRQLGRMTLTTAFREIKEKLAIGPESTLLFFNTEGATDPVNSRNILCYGKYPGVFPT